MSCSHRVGASARFGNCLIPKKQKLPYSHRTLKYCICLIYTHPTSVCYCNILRRRATTKTMADVAINVKWNGVEIQATVAPTETVAGIKRVLEEKTGVLVKKQKLLGLKTQDGKATDETPVSQLAIKANQKFMLLG